MLPEGDGPLWVCEGAFNALALLAAGGGSLVALFGVHGWRWDWVQHVRALVLALDADTTRQQQSPARSPGRTGGESRLRAGVRGVWG